MQGADRGVRMRGRACRGWRGGRRFGGVREAASSASPALGNFDAPVYVDDAPGSPGLLFVVEQRGRVQVLRDGQRLDRPFLDLTDRVRYGGEQGLLSIAFDPRYAKNRRFYVYFTNRNGDIEVDGFRRKRSSETRAGGRLAQPGDQDRAPELREPQRRPAPVRARRVPLHGHRRRRLGAATPTVTPRTATSCSASCCGSTRAREAATGPRTRTRSPASAVATRSTRSGCATRSASRFDSRSHDIFIGDVGQDSWEEIDSGLPQEARRLELRLGPASRARTPSRAAAARPLPATGARVLLTGQRLRGHRRRTSSTTRSCRRSTVATCTPTSATATCARSTRRGRGQPTRRRGSGVAQPTSFVETANGRVLVTSITGELSRIVQR